MEESSSVSKSMKQKAKLFAEKRFCIFWVIFTSTLSGLAVIIVFFTSIFIARN